MVKFSNRAKGRPTKRMTLGKKYKIRRKVNQHHRKMRRQAKKMRAKGVKHSKNPMNEALPNIYPFKNQILQQFKDKLPHQKEQVVTTLSSDEYGLLLMDYKTPYLPKVKNLSTKKFISNITCLLDKTNVILYTLDPRNPEECVDAEFQKEVQKHKKQLIFVLTKIDTINSQLLQQIKATFQEANRTLITFSTQTKFRNESSQNVMQQLKNIIAKHNLGQSITFAITGKSNTGKYSMIAELLRFNHIRAGLPDAISCIQLTNSIKIIDTPYKVSNSSKYPLFDFPADNGQQEQVLKTLLFKTKTNIPIIDRDQFLMNYSIQDFNSIDDLLKKVGKSLRIYGKGGMVDVAKVRQRLLYQWFTGKWNNMISK